MRQVCPSQPSPVDLEYCAEHPLSNLCPRHQVTGSSTANTLETTFNISAVERDTGLSKDTLRMWERRYRFPTPLRDANGERIYTASEVEKLRLIKRLMDRGHRPGRVIARSLEELSALASE